MIRQQTSSETFKIKTNQIHIIPQVCTYFNTLRLSCQCAISCQECRVITIYYHESLSFKDNYLNIHGWVILC